MRLYHGEFVLDLYWLGRGHTDGDVVIPGHGGPTDRAHLETYRLQLVRMQDMVREMNRARKSREEIQKMLETEFGWRGFVTTLGLDGVIGEMR